MRVKPIFLAIVIILVPSLLLAGNDSKNILLLVDTHTLPDSRPSSAFMFPVNKVSYMTTDYNLKAQLEHTDIIIIEWTTIMSLEQKYESELKEFLSNSVKNGRQIWLIGVAVPDNFLQDYLGLKLSTRTHRPASAYQIIASGIWKNKQKHETKNIVTATVLPRQEIIMRILDQR